MKTVKMIIAYEGTNFFGWQRQPKSRTVQNDIERVLSKIFKKQIEIDGAGRTDAGVHALGQVATFKEVIPMPLENLKRAMNNFLASDIFIIDLTFEDDDFHARYSALGKTYIYQIFNHTERDVFKANSAYLYPYQLDDTLMQAACLKLIGTHNFESFKASGSSAQNPVRTIYNIDFEREGHDITITFKGDGFLYRMVRIMTALILEIGNRRIDLNIIDEILENPSRLYTSKVAPAMGLYLKEVYYEKV